MHAQDKPITDGVSAVVFRGLGRTNALKLTKSRMTLINKVLNVCIQEMCKSNGKCESSGI